MKIALVIVAAISFLPIVPILWVEKMNREDDEKFRSR
jgi:hypothetical protein